MATQRRMGYINPHTTTSQQIRPSVVTWFLQRPHSIPFLLAIFLFLAWISLRAQRFSHTPPHSSHRDALVNLVRFHSSHVAKDNRGWLFDPIALALDSGISGSNPAFLNAIQYVVVSCCSRCSSFELFILCCAGGAVTCASLHVGEIRPGKRRGNHRHHDCNETFLIWGAAIRFRVTICSSSSSSSSSSSFTFTVHSHL